MNPIYDNILNLGSNTYFLIKNDVINTIKNITPNIISIIENGVIIIKRKNNPAETIAKIIVIGILVLLDLYIKKIVIINDDKIRMCQKITSIIEKAKSDLFKSNDTIGYIIKNIIRILIITRIFATRNLFFIIKDIIHTI